MIFNNYDAAAISALERERTGNYGEDYYCTWDEDDFDDRFDPEDDECDEYMLKVRGLI